MKKTLRFTTILVAVCFLMPNLHAQKTEGAKPKAKEYHAWWNDQNPGQPLKSPLAKKLPLIQVKGNKFVDPEGCIVLFRGLSISDPDKIENQGRWSRKHFERVKDTGAIVIRIPVHPVAWRERTPAKYLELLDQAVGWCTELGIYVMIDWHTIGNLKAGLFQDPMYETSQAETYNFWRMIARHFSGHNTVAFYELFNEPTVFSGQLGQATWSEWKAMNEEMIALIRSFDKETVVLVAGFDWAYDLTPVLYEPVKAEGIGYVTHPYSFKRPQPWEPQWEKDFGFAADQYPVVATEFGFQAEKGKTLAEDEYGPRIIRYLEGKGISWVAWVFDPEWWPQMISSWETYEPTGSGAFFKKAMMGK